MRIFLFLLAFAQLIASGARASVLPLENLGQSFYSKNIQVEWKLKTNSLPATVKIFEIVPGKFSQSVVSNVMSLGGLNKASRVESPSWAMNFRSADDRNGLVIAPGEGSMELYSRDFSTSWPTNVPNKARAVELGTNLLRLLEIPTAELMTGKEGRLSSWFYPGTMSGLDKSKMQFVKDVPRSMGIEFRRQVDHIPCDGDRIHMQFVSEEKLTQLSVRWHSVKPSKPYILVTTSQISSWIKEGRARVQSVETTGGRDLEPADIKKITMVEADIYYTGSRSLDYYDEKPATHMYPYAVLTAEAELKPGDTEIICLFVPVINEALTQAVRKSDAFGIYPSRLYEKQLGSQKETE